MSVTVAIAGANTTSRDALVAVLKTGGVTVTDTARAFLFPWDVTQEDLSRVACVSALQQAIATGEFAHALGGTPAFVVLTNCEALLERADTPQEWLARVAERANSVEAYLHTQVPATRKGFGSIQLKVHCTALQPIALGGTPKDADGKYGVQSLIHTVKETTEEYQDQTLASNFRLFFTTVLSLGFVIAIVAAAVALLITGGPSPLDPLAGQVRAYQAKEPPPEVRLSTAQLGQRLAELQTIKTSAGYPRLPPELRTFVEERLAEFLAYLSLKAKYEPPRVSPQALANDAELKKLETELQGELRPPAEYEVPWEKTELAQLRRKWQADVTLVRKAEEQIHVWYRALIQRANALPHSQVFDTAWQEQIQKLLKDAELPPLKDNAVLEGSIVLEELNAPAVKAKTPYQFARIDDDRRDWEEAKTKLLAFQSAMVATGVIPTATPAPLVLPAPTSDTAVSLALGPKVLNTLPQGAERELWVAGKNPDTAAELLKAAYWRAHAQGLNHVKAILASRMPKGPDTPSMWNTLAVSCVQDVNLNAWGKALETLAMLAGEPASNPVEELTQFLMKPKQDFRFNELVLKLPESVAIEAGVAFTITVTPIEKEMAGVKLSFVQRLSPKEKGVLFVPDGHRGEFTLAPGDDVEARVTVKVSGVAKELVWKTSAWNSFRGDVFANAPQWADAKDSAVIPALTLTIRPNTGMPKVPMLMPKPKTE